MWPLSQTAHLSPMKPIAVAFQNRLNLGLCLPQTGHRYATKTAMAETSLRTSLEDREFSPHLPDEFPLAAQVFHTLSTIHPKP